MFEPQTVHRFAGVSVLFRRSIDMPAHVIRVWPQLFQKKDKIVNFNLDMILFIKYLSVKI